MVDEEQEELLLYSAVSNLDTLKALINSLSKENINMALTIAASNGYLDSFKFLLEEGADIHTHYNYAIRWSAAHGHLEIVKLILEKVADIHKMKELAMIALKWASNAGHFDVVKFILDLVGLVNKFDIEPIKLATIFGHFDIVKLLHQNDININNEVLITAIEFDRLDILEFLVSIATKENSTIALRFALYKEKTEAIKIIINSGIDISEKDLRRAAMLINLEECYMNLSKKT